MMITKCPGNIKERLIKNMGENEKIISLIDNCVLVQYPAKSGMSYKAVNIHNFLSKYICTKTKDIDNKSYEKIYNKVINLDINYCNIEVNTDNKYNEQENLLNNIFDIILPKYSFIIRENQKDLAFRMLQSLNNNNSILCEAATGTGKTHAYLLAAIVYNIYSENKTTITIATSSIML